MKDSVCTQETQEEELALTILFITDTKKNICFVEGWYSFI